METLSISNFRNDLAASFDRADKGERVLIRRKNQIYALVSVGREDLTITPAMQKRIDEVHQAYKDGQCVTCSTPEELRDFLDAL